MNRQKIAINAAAAAVSAAKDYLKENGVLLEEGDLDVQQECLWNFIRIWDDRVSSPFLKILDFEALLFPNWDATDYEGQVIPKSAGVAITTLARDILESDKGESPRLSKIMREHLESIIENGMPYGVRVADD